MAKGMNDLVRQAQMMQKKMLQMQEDVGKREIEATSGGGMITVKVTGNQELTGIVIDPSVVNPQDVEMLQDLILAAINDGMRKAKEMMQNEMAAITGGLKIPGLF